MVASIVMASAAEERALALSALSQRNVLAHPQGQNAGAPAACGNEGPYTDYRCCHMQATRI